MAVITFGSDFLRRSATLALAQLRLRVAGPAATFGATGRRPYDVNAAHKAARCPGPTRPAGFPDNDTKAKERDSNWPVT